MQHRRNLVRMILAGVIALGLVPLVVCVDAQAQIAFSSNRDGNWEIYVMDNDGNNLQRLTNNLRHDRSPSWSPNGKRIVFTSDRNEHFINFITEEIYVMDNNGRHQQNLTNNPFDDRSPSWSPDGKRIVFTSDRDERFSYDIYVMDADGDNPQNLTNSPNGEDDYSPSWSPDGKRIVFSARRGGHFIGEAGITEEIYVMDNDGDNLQRLTNNRQNDWSPSWSPDGRRIAFASDRKGDFKNFEIYVMDNDGDNLQRLTNNRQKDDRPSWSPDGSRIAFSTRREGNSEIYVMDNDGANQQNITNNPNNDFSPAWLNSPFSVSPVGKKLTMWGRFKQGDR